MGMPRLGTLMSDEPMTPGTPPEAPAAGYDFWLKANSLALSDGDPIPTWPDDGPLGEDFTQSGIARPTFKTNIVNGMPVVRFDGVNDKMVNTNVGGPLGSNIAWAWFAVFRITGTPTVNQVIMFVPATVQGQMITARRHATGKQAWWTASASGWRESTLSVSDDTWYIGFWEVYLVATTYRIHFRLNDADGGTVLMSSSSILAGTSWHLGNNNGSDFFKGDIAEILIYHIPDGDPDNRLSTSDRDTTMQYLAGKYGITLS